MNNNDSGGGLKLDYIIIRLKCGLAKTLQPSTTTALVVIYILSVLYMWHKAVKTAKLNYTFPSHETLASSYITMIIVGTALIIYLCGAPLGSGIINRRLEKIGLKNRVGESPMLIDSMVSSEGYKTMLFFSQGIPISEWEKFRPELGAALNMEIGEIKPFSGKWLVKISAVRAGEGLSNTIWWNDSYVISKDFVLNLGRGVMGSVTVDLANIPHMLVGGSSGSGKSELMRAIIVQCVFKGADVYIADWKGGVDYGLFYRDHCNFITIMEDLITMLDYAVNELKERTKLLAESGAKDIAEYNRINKGYKLERIIIAFDEVAEVLDRTGVDKAYKEKIAAVESRLATIARLGRAPGIHLVLSMQRPDATILSGQIKNNIDIRCCGRAEEVLSKIILDNTLAADEIPKDSRGLFIMPDGTKFKGYKLDSRYL